MSRVSIRFSGTITLAVTSPCRSWGRPALLQIIQGRLCGFTWNMIEGTPGEFRVTEVHPDQLRTIGLLTSEAFAVAHDLGQQPFDRVVYEHDFYQVEAILLEHGTPSVGYCVREKLRHNVDPASLSHHGLEPGPWLRTVKDPCVSGEQVVVIGDRPYRVEQLREQLMVETVGDSVAYLTDFRLDDETLAKLTTFLRGCQTLVCENNYANCDADLAARNYHMVSRDVARLADAIQPERLILVHLSDRYTAPGWRLQLEEVHRVFPRSYFPDDWHL